MAEHRTPRDADSLSDVEFTHRWYRRFLESLQEAGYQFTSFTDSLGVGDVLLRHDVDLSVEAALTMAQIEAELDITSTYFVLVSSALYNPFERAHSEALAEIEALGHEIGLHFSTHRYWPADEPPAAEAIETRVAAEQTMLETVCSPVETVSFHRPPSWVLNRTFAGFRSTYESRVFDEIGYVADSNQRWRQEPPDVDSFPETAQVLTHPGLWAAVDADFDERVTQAVRDACTHTERATRHEFGTEPATGESV